jgi:CRP/FNR family transcriptional regulator
MPDLEGYSPGETIFREGEGTKGRAYLVHAGRVEIRKRLADEERVLRVLGRGDLLGELALFRDDTRHSASAVAVEPVTLVVIPAGRLLEIVRSNPVLAVALIRQLAVRIFENEARDR